MKYTLCGVFTVLLLPFSMKAQQQQVYLGPMQNRLYSVSLNGIVDIKPFLELGYERLLTNRVAVAVYPGVYLPFSYTLDDSRSVSNGSPASYRVCGGRLRADMKVYLRMPEKVRERTNYFAFGLLTTVRHEDLAGWVNRYGSSFREYRNFGMNRSHIGLQMRVGEQWLVNPTARTTFFIDYWCGIGVRYSYTQFIGLPADVVMGEIDSRNIFEGSNKRGSAISPLFSAGLKVGIGRP